MAKINGQLENAQLENKSADYSTGVAGRFWLNTTSLLPKYDTGAAIKTLVDTDSTQTLTGKTLTGNTAANLKPSALNTLTLPDATDTLVGRATADTITNKTIVAANNTITTAASLANGLTETELNAALAQLASLIAAVTGNPRGTVIASISSTAPAGYISAMNKTIGNAGADYSGADYQGLYEEIWAMTGLSTTAGNPFRIASAKGASAAADWAAGKLITVDFLTNEVFIRSKGASRNLGDYQADAFQNITGSFGFTDNDATTYRARVGSATGVFSASDTTNNTLGMTLENTTSANTQINFDASDQARTADETRPKNVALNYFIKT
jgi:hypothetical protein